jgi:hypothetical protein
MGRRRDAAGVDLLHLAGVGEDLAELARKEVEICLVELKVGQGGDSLDLLAHQTLRHGPILQCPMNIRLPAVAGCSYPGNPTSLAVAKRHTPSSQPAPDYMIAPAEALWR